MRGTIAVDRAPVKVRNAATVRVERRGGRFVLTGLVAELHEAAGALGFARDGDAFVRTFPEDARWLDAAWENFPRHIGSMLHQTASGVAPWDEALTALLDRAAGVDWWLTGSAALAVRGVEVSPRDLDLVTDAAGAQRLGELLADALVELHKICAPPVAARASAGGEPVWVKTVSYTHLTLPTNREV